MTKQQVALITGGAKRIGSAITKSLHHAGFLVIIHYHTSDDEAVQLCNALNDIRPNSAKIIKANLSLVNDKQAMAEFAKQILALFGRLDVLINNASSFYPSDLHADFNTLACHWDDLFLTNAKAPFFLSHAFMPMLQRFQGCIISLLDIHADGKPFFGYSIYSMAKAAHRMMVQSLVLELAPNVRVNGVAPGVNVFPEQDSHAKFDGHTKAILAQSVPLGVIGTPDNIANAVMFLLQASYITGQVIAVDGGRSLTLRGG